MKHFWLLFLILFNGFLDVFGQEAENVSDEKGKQGLWKETEIPDYPYAHITYKDGIKHGPFMAFYENDMVAIRGSFKDDKLDGKHEQFYKSGALYIRTTWANGMEHGLREVFYESGIIYKMEPFVYGLLDGVWEQYDKDGAIQIWYEAKNDQPHGLYKIFHENGQIALTGYHEDGKEIGQWFKMGVEGDTLEIIEH